MRAVIYYRSAHAIVLVYDVACQPSFDCLPEWLGEIEQYANRRVLKILVGNKVDKEDEREIPERIGKNFADANAFDYFLETSALDATNLAEMKKGTKGHRSQPAISHNFIEESSFAL
uniref:Uncharacterized protein n=1 Tax=Parascaris equorum TaxID=6256 RepID=A0A914RLZ2_PAREQ